MTAPPPYGERPVLDRPPPHKPGWLPRTGLGALAAAVAVAVPLGAVFRLIQWATQ